MNERISGILDIDVTSYAARVAHVAAAEFAGLIRGSYKPNWAGLDVPDPDAMEQAIGRLAGYIVGRGCDSGERLYLWARGEGLIAPEKPRRFVEADMDAREAFDLFVATFRHVHGRLKTAQLAADAEAEIATRPPAAKPKIEDTIYAPVEPLSTMRPEAVQAAKNAAMARGGKSGGASGKTKGEAPAALSAGEVPAAGVKAGKRD